jgi:hypothetical protein
MLKDELLRDPAQHKSILVVGIDLAQESDPVHEVDRDGNAALDESVQELILKHPGSTDGMDGPEHPTPSEAWQAISIWAASHDLHPRSQFQRHLVSGETRRRSR